MNYYQWDNDKNGQLKLLRGIGFEQIVMHIARGDLLEIVNHPNASKYPEQQIIIVNVNEYAYLVPFVKKENEIFLKTIIPSRKATNHYLRDKK
ncbi:MAG: toxin [Candidatus Brocadiales bacterium]|nr:toxin [Candidatus Brocadiales bacterium]